MSDESTVALSKSLLTIIQRKCQKDDHLGYLHHFMVGTKKFLVSCSTMTHGDNSGHIYDTVKRSLPAGIEVCGLYFVAEDPSDRAAIEKKCKAQLRTAIGNLSEQSQVLLLAVGCPGTTESIFLYEYNADNGYFINVPFSLSETDILSTCMLVRLQGYIPLDREHDKNSEKMTNDLLTEVDYWKEELRCPTTAFHVKQSDILLFYSDEGTSNNYTCRNILGYIRKDDEDEYDRKKKQKLNDFSKEVIHLSLLCQRTGEVACRLSMSCAPIIRHNHGSFTQLDVGLPIDIVAYVHPDTLTDYLTYILVESICDQLDALCQTLTSCPDGELRTPVPYHFKPESLGHIISMSYPQEVPNESNDSQLLELRQQYHTIYNLPDSIPQLKRLNVFMFPDENLPGGCLINPHVGLPKSGVNDGCASMVWGLYAYHHYMQDRTDDNGWGCAYRSLQTLISWFRLQGYTDKPIPSHKQIQQALVDIGDKDKKFVGTKQWIGSTEVSYVLDHLLEVTSKILFVSSGAELESKGRELAIHFDTQGTPVMIGGGVLAHTILGVDFNEVTGEVKFLILDPHYTGGEDLKLIQDKGWCGWKGPEFWDKNAYYNMCMPQRPNMI